MIDIFICPLSVYKQYGRFVNAFGMLKGYNILPVAGGFLEQSVDFIKATKIVSSEINRLRESD